MDFLGQACWQKHYLSVLGRGSGRDGDIFEAVAMVTDPTDLGDLFWTL